MAYKHGAGVNNSTAGTNALAFGSAVAIGDLLCADVCQIFGGNPPRDITSVVDNLGNTYTVRKATQNGGDTLRVATYSVVSGFAGTPTVTVTFAVGSADSALSINCYDSAYTVIDSQTAANTGTGTSATTSSYTPTGTCLFRAVMVDEAGGTITLADGTWNNRQEQESSATCPQSNQDKETTGAQNPTWTLGTSGNWGAVGVAYQATPASGNYTLMGAQCG